MFDVIDITDLVVAGGTTVALGIQGYSQGTALSGPIFTLLTGLGWIYVGIHMCKALPSPVCA